MKIVFVSGTGTEVGKTYVTASLATAMVGAGRRVGIYKPVASGCIAVNRFREGDAKDFGQDWVSGDAVTLWNAIGRRGSLNTVCPQRFIAAVAPDEAARREGKRVDEAMLLAGVDAWKPLCDILLVEGAGGLFSPISDEMLNVDLANRIDADEVILVGPNRLGVIHDVVATCRAALSCGIEPRYLYLSATEDGLPDESVTSNAVQIQRWCPRLCVRPIGWGENVSPPEEM